MCDLLAIFNFHALANIMVDRIFVRRSFVFERFTDSANSFFKHVGIEHAFVKCMVSYVYTKEASKQKVLDTMYINVFMM